MVDEFEDMPDEQIEEIPKKKIAPKPVEPLYSAYHMPERAGILETKTNKIVGEDILGILAVILNKLDKIEKATC